MNDESTLREKARNAIKSGKLPTRRASRTFGGPGSGMTCVVCDELLTQAQVELKVEFNRHGVTARTGFVPPASALFRGPGARAG
jgi:hypothetical protein